MTFLFPLFPILSFMHVRQTLLTV